MKLTAVELLRLIAQWAILVGALNWGTYGLLGVDVIKSIFGTSTVATFFYGLIALSGIFIILLKVLMIN